MDSDKYFKIVFLILFVIAILVYGISHRYQFMYVQGTLTGFACNQYTGKCEWLSPEEMGKDKFLQYSQKQQRLMGGQLGPQAAAPGQPPSGPKKE
jgi:hypothetical protein